MGDATSTTAATNRERVGADAGASGADDAAAPADAGALSERVLLLAPSGRDAMLLASQLCRRGFGVTACADATALCDAIGAGAGAAFIAAEALSRGDDLNRLVDALRHQPPWSDLPVIVMTEAVDSSARGEKVAAALTASGNLTLLQRPVRLATLFSVVESALKSRRRQYEVRDLLEQTRSAVEQRDRFLAILGHELRNPLAAVVNAMAILKRFGGGDAALAAEQHEVIDRQSAHMARLVDDLLDVARITSGKVVLTRARLDLRDLATRTVKALGLTPTNGDGAGRHHVSLEMAGHPVIVDGDAVRLEQVLMNLVTNAVKYTPEGGRIRVTVGDRDGNAFVSVTDTGDGIPADMIERIFEPFTQLGQSLARSRGGLGMGLAVVRSLVEMHGGRVTARSDGPGRGTEFIMSLPLVRGGAGVSNAAPAAEARPVNSCDVLVVEDNPDSRRTLAKLLRLYGHKVDVAADGREGVEKAIVTRPEVVLMDIGLPEMDGYEAGRRVRAALGDRVFLIALTGYGQAEDRERVRQAGFDLHLVKPVDPERLNQLLSARVCNDGRRQ